MVKNVYKVYGVLYIWLIISYYWNYFPKTKVIYVKIKIKWDYRNEYWPLLYKEFTYLFYNDYEINTFDSMNAKRVPINLINIHDIIWKAYPCMNIKSTAHCIKITSTGNSLYIRINMIWFVKMREMKCPKRFFE